MEKKLRESPFKYRFHPVGMMSPNEYFIVLQFPLSSLMLKENSTRYFLLAFFLIMLILILFLMTMRTILRKEKLDVMKSDFINNMTHEIKTPIATIGLACEMLQDPSIASDPANNGTYIGIISDENRRMKLLIETILQNAKMSNKKFTLNRSEIDINEIASSVAKNFQLKVSSLGGTLECDLQQPSPTLSADELHITNMIYNLIDNAIKYSPKEVAIKVTTRSNNNKVTLSVSDKGLGISREDQKHIFEKFYRVSTGDVHNVKGFGIGLNYVMQVVNAHGGKISVDSTLGEGSTFTVELPI
jgi:two-component system phosphate regulon sensor histidine kinase PhoR